MKKRSPEWKRKNGLFTSYVSEGEICNGRVINLSRHRAFIRLYTGEVGVIEIDRNRTALYFGQVVNVKIRITRNTSKNLYRILGVSSPKKFLISLVKLS